MTTTPKQDLQTRLGLLSQGLSKAGFVEGREQIVFDDTTLWVFDGEIGCLTPAPEGLGLKGAVEGAKLVQFVGKAPRDTITFKQEDDILKLRSGRSSLTIPWLVHREMPLAQPKKWRTVTDEVSEGLQFTALCCSPHLTVAQWKNLQISGDTLMATDGNRAIEYKLETPVIKGTLLLHRNAAQMAARIVPDKIGIGENCLWFKNEDGACVFARTIPEGFDRAMDLSRPSDKDGVEFALPLQKLEGVLNRAKLFSVEDKAEGERYIDVTVKGQRLYVRTESEQSVFEEWIPLDKATPDLVVTLNAQHLVDLVRQPKTTRCVLVPSRGVLWIGTKKWKHLAQVKSTGV